MLQIYIIFSTKSEIWPKMLQLYSNSAAIAANLTDSTQNDADLQEFGQTRSHPRKNDVKLQHFQLVTQELQHPKPGTQDRLGGSYRQKTAFLSLILAEIQRWYRRKSTHMVQNKGPAELGSYRE